MKACEVLGVQVMQRRRFDDTKKNCYDMLSVVGIAAAGAKRQNRASMHTAAPQRCLEVNVS